MLELSAAATSVAQAASGLELGAPQFLFIVILVFAVIGFQRGWRRGLVTLGFYLGVLLVLVLGGGKGIANFFFNILPQAIQVIGGNAGAKSPGVQATDLQVQFVELVTLTVVIVIGYVVSNRAFPKPTKPEERLLGILPSVVGGYALVYYVSNNLISSSTLLMIKAPDGSAVGSSLVIIFVIAVVVVVAALVAANAKKPSGGKK